MSFNYLTNPRIAYILKQLISGLFLGFIKNYLPALIRRSLLPLTQFLKHFINPNPVQLTHDDLFIVLKDTISNYFSRRTQIDKVSHFKIFACVSLKNRFCVFRFQVHFKVSNERFLLFLRSQRPFQIKFKKFFFFLLVLF